MLLRVAVCNVSLTTVIAALGCGSTPPPAAQSVASAPTATADAGSEPAPPDALPDAVVNAPPFVFRYATAERVETWTLKHADGTALLVVENAQGPRRYSGPAIDKDGALVVDVATAGAKLALKCKREKLAVSAKCNDRRAKPIDVLSCYHADFTTPMPFAPPPGIEYIVDGTCNGYRLISP